jgi:hypothetical protein
MKRSVKTLSLTIPRDLYEDVVGLAQKDGRSLSNYVGWVLAWHVERKLWREIDPPNSPVKPD